MIQLPENKFFEGFYIWFDKEKKEENYGTPLYLYNTNAKLCICVTRLLTKYFC